MNRWTRVTLFSAATAALTGAGLGGCVNGDLPAQQKGSPDGSAPGDGSAAMEGSTVPDGSSATDSGVQDGGSESSGSGDGATTGDGAGAPSAWRSAATSGPSVRDQAAMVYDSKRGVTVLFGGFNGTVEFGDTWEWNGTTWTQAAPSTSPPGRAAPAMAFDSTRGVMVLFGGCKGGVACIELNDTWEWDGTNWTQLSSSTSPAARNGHEMVYDSARGVAVLFGGWSNATSTEFNDTWEWNGTNWAQATPATSPAARDYTAMIYDSTRNVTVLFGGRNNGNHTYYADTWQWDGTNWTQLVPSTSPTVRGLGSAAFDTSLGATVLFGGMNTGGLLNETWLWNGTNWTQQSSTTSPSARWGSAMTYDGAHGTVVMFGGSNGGTLVGGLGGFFNDTWVF